MKALTRYSLSVVPLTLKLPLQTSVGWRVTMLMTPVAAVRPPRVACGPLSTSMLCTSSSALPARESEGIGTPSIMRATPEDRPTVPSLETEEMPRTPSGTRPLIVPFNWTEGTRRLRSEMSPAFCLRISSEETTEAATATSSSFSVRFCAVMTISSSDGSAVTPTPSAPVAMRAYAPRPRARETAARTASLLEFI